MFLLNCKNYPQTVRMKYKIMIRAGGILGDEYQNTCCVTLFFPLILQFILCLQVSFSSEGGNTICCPPYICTVLWVTASTNTPWWFHSSFLCIGGIVIRAVLTVDISLIRIYDQLMELGENKLKKMYGIMSLL